MYHFQKLHAKKSRGMESSWDGKSALANTLGEHSSVRTERTSHFFHRPIQLFFGGKMDNSLFFVLFFPSFR